MGTRRFERGFPQPGLPQRAGHPAVRPAALCVGWLISRPLGPLLAPELRGRSAQLGGLDSLPGVAALLTLPWRLKQASDGESSKPWQRLGLVMRLPPALKPAARAAQGRWLAGIPGHGSESPLGGAGNPGALDGGIAPQLGLALLPAWASVPKELLFRAGL